MINGAHFLIYSKDADADRAFIRDVLGFRPVDAGHGWLIFGLPPSELAVHPGEGDFTQDHAGHEMLGIVLYLMCDDVHAACQRPCCRSASADIRRLGTAQNRQRKSDAGAHSETVHRDQYRVVEVLS